jgi:hypothetical protein
MNVYRPDTPRAAFGIAAAAMTAVTMALMVVLPAELEDAGAAEYTLAKSAPASMHAAVVHRGLDVSNATCDENGMVVRIAYEGPLTCVELPILSRPVAAASLRDRS